MWNYLENPTTAFPRKRFPFTTILGREYKVWVQWSGWKCARRYKAGVNTELPGSARLFIRPHRVTCTVRFMAAGHMHFPICSGYTLMSWFEFNDHRFMDKNGILRTFDTKYLYFATDDKTNLTACILYTSVAPICFSSAYQVKILTFPYIYHTNSFSSNFLET